MFEEEYKVELIVKKRLCKGKTEYLVKSKRWEDPVDYTWEPVANVDWEELIEDSKRVHSGEEYEVESINWNGWEDPKESAWKTVVAHLDYKGLTEEYETEDFDKMKIKIDKVMAEQVEVVGSLRLYEKIHENFLEAKFDQFFVKEQYDLCKWRENFFRANFPSR